MNQLARRSVNLDLKSLMFVVQGEAGLPGLAGASGIPGDDGTSRPKVGILGMLSCGNVGKGGIICLPISLTVEKGHTQFILNTVIKHYVLSSISHWYFAVL